MPQPSEAYREGYEKGRSDNLGGSLAEITMGMLRDDPGGYYAAGYYDGAGGRKFNVHGSKDTKAGPRKPSAPSLPSPPESQWYQLCDASEFIPKETVDRSVATLNAAGSQVAAIIGLSAFTSHTCPRCGKSGHFRIHFLGRLRHPGACGWEGYMKTGSYIGHQIAQVFHTGIRAGGAWKDDADDKQGGSNWGYLVLGFVFVAFYRALAAVVLIPLHCVAVLSQPGQKRADIATPLITLAVIMTGIGIGIYELQQASRPQFRASQQYFPPPQVSTPTQAPVVQTPASQITPGSNSSIASQAPARPSFDCAKARTRVELLICRDSRLAELEVTMASAYHEALARLPQDAQLALRREHLAWFKNYSRACNQITDDNDRSACIANYLSTHTAELTNKR